MAVGPNDNVRMIIRMVGSGETLYANTYYTKILAGPSISDSQALADLEDWATDLLAAIASQWDSEIDLSDCQVDLVEVTGVYNPDPELNTAKVSVVRPLGFISPAFTPTANAEEYDGVVTATVTPKCFTPGPKPRKSLSGFTEVAVVQKVFNNFLMGVLTTFAIRWMGGPSMSGATAPWIVGTMSLVSAIFEAFDGTFTIKNTGGTQVTRKIGRGS